MPPINYDRGVMLQKIPSTGVEIYMYLDSPGIFLNAHGDRVDDKVAEQAGYDVKTLGKSRQMQERLEEAKRKIAAELKIEQPGSAQQIVAERGGYKVLHAGSGLHWLLDPDGQNLTNTPLPEKAALQLLHSMTPDADPPEGEQGAESNIGSNPANPAGASGAAGPKNPEGTPGKTGTGTPSKATAQK